jgi:hypothetical protein|tara:strand:+ start:2495 stop:2707 length:213 start_codon:yes stop_codon:yes gene_type:complete
MNNELENLRQECGHRVNSTAELYAMHRGMSYSAQKEFSDYVMERQHVFADYMQQAWRDLYENFRQDAGYE